MFSYHNTDKTQWQTYKQAQRGDQGLVPWEEDNNTWTTGEGTANSNGRSVFSQGRMDDICSRLDKKLALGRTGRTHKTEWDPVASVLISPSHCYYLTACLFSVRWYFLSTVALQSVCGHSLVKTHHSKHWNMKASYCRTDTLSVGMSWCQAPY